MCAAKKGKRKVQGAPQPQIAAPPRHQEEEETDKPKQAQIEQTHGKHQDSQLSGRGSTDVDVAPVPAR